MFFIVEYLFMSIYLRQCFIVIWFTYMILMTALGLHSVQRVVQNIISIWSKMATHFGIFSHSTGTNKINVNII